MIARQQRLLLGFALLLVLQTGLYLVQYFGELESGGRFGGDFIAFWKAAQHLHAGNVSAIYDPAGWARVLAQGTPAEFSWFVYPPYMLLGLWPVGGLGYGEAVAWWSLAPLPFFAGLLWVLARRAGLEGRGTAVLLAFTLPLLSANLFSGQTGAWLGVFLMGAVVLLPRRPLLAGVCIGLIAVKPQLGVLLPLALAASGQWRAFGAAAVTVVALAVSATLWLGAGIWGDYLEMTRLFGRFIGEGYDGIRPLVVGPYVSLTAVGVPAGLAAAVQAAVALGVVVAVWRLFRDEAASSELRWGMLAVGALLVTPYSLAYDTPLLALAMLPLLARAWRGEGDGLELAALAALVLLPFTGPLLIEQHVPFALGALLLTAAALWRRYRAAGSVVVGSAQPVTA